MRLTARIALAGVLPCLAAAAEETAIPSAAVMQRVKAQGFAVCHERPMGLHSVYRFERQHSIFVTADSALGAYALLLRQVVDGLAFDCGTTLQADIDEWLVALIRSADPLPEQARFYVAVLRELCEDKQEGLSAAAREARKLTGKTRIEGKAPIEVLGTELDYARVRTYWIDRGLPQAARWNVAVHWLTRAALPDTPQGANARSWLQLTMPDRLRKRVTDQFRSLGTVTLRTGGRPGVFGFDVPGDLRFPSGTLPEHAHVIALDFAAHLGSPLALELATAEPIWDQVQPWPQETGWTGLYRAFVDVLRSVPTGEGEALPGLFKTRAWRALEIQSIVAAEVLYRHSVGPLNEGTEYFGISDVPGFAHPQPRFWKTLGALCRETAATAKALGLGQGLPSQAESKQVHEILKRTVRKEERIPARCLSVLLRAGVSRWRLRSLEKYGKGRPEHEAVKRSVEEFVRETWWYRDRDRRAAGADHVALARLGALAEACDGFAGLAEAQLRGDDVRPFKKLFPRYGVLLNRIVAGYHFGDPVVVSVVGFTDVDTVLVQGCGPVDELWLAYPYEGKTILCRGAVLSYREQVSSRWPTTDEWRQRAESGEAARPRWSKLFFAGK